MHCLLCELGVSTALFYESRSSMCQLGGGGEERSPPPHFLDGGPGEALFGHFAAGFANIPHAR